MDKNYHNPVLLKESVDGMNLRKDSVCVDVTFGGGGHSNYILSLLGDSGKLVSFDQDMDAIQNAANDDRLIFVRSNFRYLSNFLKYHNIEKIDALLADLGVSSHHFDTAERGFSFRFEQEPLDMRMNQKSKKTAATILNNYSQSELADVFYFYGELRQARKIANIIVEERKKKPFEKISDFLQVMNSFTKGNKKEKQILAQAFQALRIEVNDEMSALKEMLLQALMYLKKGGRLSVITYHSLEDRILKNFFKTGNFEGNVEKDLYGNNLSPFKLINTKVIIPTEEEIESNPRARSAKLRIVEKI